MGEWQSSTTATRRAARRRAPAAALFGAIIICRGDVAQLGERRVRNAKVEGSIPFVSTRLHADLREIRPTKLVGLIVRKSTISPPWEPPHDRRRGHPAVVIRVSSRPAPRYRSRSMPASSGMRL